MFFSQTFLARNGPLGTVWCAAHVQHILKKSHYTSTDISSSVERIMFPEVPIALRIQGHLLLGVVRIFSKKVDYLLHDCNVVRTGVRNAFTSVQVDLPKDTTQAAYYSVTLPDKFELDALDIDMGYDEGFKDKHLRNQEDITLTDQIYFGGSPYITININEDILREMSMRATGSPLGSRQLDKNVHYQALEDPVTEPSDHNEDEQNLSTPERILPVVNGSPVVNLLGPLLGKQVDIMEPDQEIEKDVMRADLNQNSSMEEDKSNSVPQQREGVNVFDANNLHGELQQSPVMSPNFELQQSSARSPNFEVQPSPAPVVQPAVRKRKRRLFDDRTVLTNEFMRASLDNTTNIRRKRRCGSSSVLGVWKFSNKMAKEKVFHGPLITGISEDLNSLYQRDYIASKPHLAKESVPESNNSSSGPPSNVSDIEIETIRDNRDPANESILPDPLYSHNEPVHSPRTGDFTHQLDDDVRSIPELQFESTAGTIAGTVETGEQWTERLGSSAGTVGSDMSDQMAFRSEQSKLSDIPEMMESAFEDELDFLVKEDGTPSVANSGGVKGNPTLSQTTIKLAEYLKEKSACTPISGPSSGDLVLDKLVEGKTRKICARMFYQTLVLKNCGLVDVHQEEPYADITLKLTPQIYKGQI